MVVYDVDFRAFLQFLDLPKSVFEHSLLNHRFVCGGQYVLVGATSRVYHSSVYDTESFIYGMGVMDIDFSVDDFMRSVCDDEYNFKLDVDDDRYVHTYEVWHLVDPRRKAILDAQVYGMYDALRELDMVGA